MIVIGAGMGGLIAAAMLRKDCEKVLEAKDGLPDNHAAVLRFKSSIVGDTLNIPFKKVKALKAVHPWRNPVADAMAYSKKTNNSYSLRSITSANGELHERYIAPQGFPSKIASAVSAEILFGIKVGATFMQSLNKPSISTLPMPMMMDILGWEGAKPEFQSIEGWSVTATIPGCDMYCSLYVPDPELSIYRISISGNQLIAEASVGSRTNDRDALLAESLEVLGLRGVTISNAKIHHQRFMKILPIDETIRRSFIMWATEKHKVYSLGRFATWRPGLLLDDIVNDVRVIQKIQQTTNYDHRSRQ